MHGSTVALQHAAHLQRFLWTPETRGQHVSPLFRKKAMKTPEFKHLGSLITVEQDGQETALGYLFDAPGHGIYDAHFGGVGVTSEDAKTHNQLLDQALIKGLEENCRVGLGGTFYCSRTSGKTEVRTWLGTIVSERAVLRGNVLTFQRKGMKFRGRVRKDEDCFNFRRVA